MSDVALTPQETRRKTLVRTAGLTVLLSLAAVIAYSYLSITTQNWYNYLVAGALIQLTVVSFLVARSGQSVHPRIGAWHLLSSVILTALVVSTVQADVGAEAGSAVLVIILVLAIQTMPPEQAMRGAIIGAFTSVACSVLAFYSPVPQTTDATANLIIAWVARGSTLAFLALIFRQFRNLNLANKLLISFLSVVVTISMTYNVVTTTYTTNTLTNQIGQRSKALAEGRGAIVGDYLTGRIEVLQTLALDETIRQSVRSANALKPELENILELDEQWKQAVASGITNSLINSRLSNSLSNDLRAFQGLAPENTEVFVTDQNGALVAATNVTSDYYQADEEWWTSAFKSGEGTVYLSQPEFDESIGALSILAAVPIYDTRQGNLIGILRSTISIDSLINVLSDPIGETGEIDIYFPGQKMLNTRNSEYEEVSPESSLAIQEATNRVYWRATYEGEDSILAQSLVNARTRDSKVNEMGWRIIVSQSTNEALAPVRDQVRASSLFGTITAGISAILSLLVAQRLAKPIINLTETANDIARGNLAARAEVEAKDEIGQLSESFNAMTSQLQESLVGLETRVNERTAELEESSKKLERRAGQFEAIAQLARTITSIQDLDTLLPRITQLINRQFGFYHVGLFLLDESRQYAVLSAANSEGGQRMLARKHRLGVGQTGIVGYVTSTGNPRVALDTGADAVFFNNPDLPDTHSEMALPLRVGRVIIGALDVQSTEPNAFTEEDVEVLSILADEVSVAIENARLYGETQRVLADAQSAFGEFTKEAWQQMVTRRKVVGYELAGASIRSLEEPIESNGSSMSIPIKLRDQVIGHMNVNLPDNKMLDADEIDITQALAQRVGIAIENATLLEESRRRASRESLISDISAKLSATAEIEHLMEVAVGELRDALGATEVTLKIGNNEDEKS